MTQVFTLYRGMSVLRRGSREIEEIKFLLSSHLIFKWLESRSVIWACLTYTMISGQEVSLYRKFFPLLLSQNSWIYVKVIHSIIRNRKIKMQIAWERIQYVWLFIKLYQSRWRSYCVFKMSWVVIKKKVWLSRERMYYKESKDFTIFLRATLFIIISKWENGKRSVHMLKDYLDLQLNGEYPSKLFFSPPLTPFLPFI